MAAYQSRAAAGPSAIDVRNSGRGAPNERFARVDSLRARIAPWSRPPATLVRCICVIPFLVHAAQPHKGERPRFLAQPPLLPVDPEIGRTEISVL